MRTSDVTPQQMKPSDSFDPEKRAPGTMAASSTLNQTGSRQGQGALSLVALLLGLGSATTEEPNAVDGRIGGSLRPGRWLRDVLAPMRSAYLQIVVLACVINLIGLFSAVFALQVYDRVVAKGGMSTLVALVIGMALAIVLDHLLRGGRAILLQRVGARIEVRIARAVYERLMRLPALELEARPPAYWQTIFRDIELVRATTAGATVLLLVDIPFLLVTLGLIGLIAAPLLPVMLGIMLFFAVLAWRSERVMKPGSVQEREKLLGRDAMLSDLAASRLHLKAVGPSDPMRSRWEWHYSQWMTESLARSREGDHFRDLAHAMSVASTVIVTTVGALAILNQMMSMGALIAANILSGKLVSPLVQLVGQWRNFGQFEAACSRLDQLFALSLDRESAPVAIPRPAGALLMEKLQFRYPGMQHDQVDTLSGQFGPHGLHCIVGANGSGKSTVLKLLRGLYQPGDGRILLDGADLKQFGQRDLAQWIGLLPQQPRLVSGTIRHNIALGNDEVTDEQIILAAKRAGAYDFIVNLPDGFDTDVGEGGHRFSGGQRKRIAVAQTLLNDPPILLLDEPTSDLDTAAELNLVHVLRELAKDHTVVVVSHSPTLLSQANGILVMDRGRMLAAGPAHDLLPKLGLARPTATVASAHSAMGAA